MERICKRGHKMSDWGNTCIECKWREDKIAGWIIAGIIAFIFLAILGVKLLWAQYAYHDWRCTFSECRIMK